VRIHGLAPAADGGKRGGGIFTGVRRGDVLVAWLYRWGLAGQRASIAAGGGTLTELREQQRTAAGLSGKEIWISFSEPGEKPSVRFTWHYPGVADTPTQPAIDIVGFGPVDKKPQLEAAWKTILTSLHAVPLAAGTK